MADKKRGACAPSGSDGFILGFEIELDLHVVGVTEENLPTSAIRHLIYLAPADPPVRHWRLSDAGPGARPPSSCPRLRPATRYEPLVPDGPSP
jgi:hypothetical protein